MAPFTNTKRLLSACVYIVCTFYTESTHPLSQKGRRFYIYLFIDNTPHYSARKKYCVQIALFQAHYLHYFDLQLGKQTNRECYRQRRGKLAASHNGCSNDILKMENFETFWQVSAAATLLLFARKTFDVTSWARRAQIECGGNFKLRTLSPYCVFAKVQIPISSCMLRLFSKPNIISFLALRVTRAQCEWHARKHYSGQDIGGDFACYSYWRLRPKTSSDTFLARAKLCTTFLHACWAKNILWL